MKFLEFDVDKNLKIMCFNEEFGRLSISQSQSFYGAPYYDLLPRIFANDKDVVEAVIQNKEPAFLENYRFGCFFNSLVANVRISPLNNCQESLPAARVGITFLHDCDLFSSFKKCQHLIDIGKNASILAHGVRNPLNAIKGSVVFLKNKFSHENTLLEFASIIDDEIGRLDKFITEFLSASNKDTKNNKIYLPELIGNIEKLIMCQVKNCRVIVEFSSCVDDTISGNLFQIEQAILNVINNAFNAVYPEGKILVNTRVETVQNKNFAVIEVKDDGGGLCKHSGRVDFTSLEIFAERNGKGFGLFISREVMKHHGGMLEIRSDAETGTLARLCLPLDMPQEV